MLLCRVQMRTGTARVRTATVFQTAEHAEAQRPAIAVFGRATELRCSVMFASLEVISGEKALGALGVLCVKAFFRRFRT
jgi:hypothetical protein